MQYFAQIFVATIFNPTRVIGSLDFRDYTVESRLLP